MHSITGSAYSQIDVLKLSRRAHNCLWRAGINTVAQLAAMSDDELLAIRNLGVTALTEIREKLSAYLDSQPLPEQPRKSQSVLLEPITRQPQHLGSLQLEPPLADQIPTSDTTSIEALGLSNRSYNALMRAGIKTIGQLAHKSWGQIQSINNVGEKTLAEIREKLTAHLATDPFPQYPRPSEPSPPEPTPHDSQVSESPQREPPLVSRIPIADKTPIEVLELSIRTYNALGREGITTIGWLAQMSREQILDIKNVGAKALSEVETKLKAYLAAHPLIDEVQPTTLESKSPPPPLVNPSLLTQAQTRKVPIDDILLSRLALSINDETFLITAGITTVGVLASKNQADLLKHNYFRRNPSSIFRISDQLNRYFAWLLEQDETAWFAEVTERNISPMHQLRLAGATLDDLVDSWLGTLQDRDQQIIRHRYGLDGVELTLEEIGNLAGVTRERVRQIQKRALNRLRRQSSREIVRSLAVLLKNRLQQAGGLINEDEIDTILRKELVVINVDPVGVARLLFELDDDCNALGRKVPIWTNRPLTDVETVQNEFYRLLREHQSPLSVQELIRMFKETDVPRSCQNEFNEPFLVACLELHPNIEIDDDEMCVLTRWVSRRLDKIILALRELGEPTHYSRIAEIINSGLPPERHIAERTVHNRLLQHPELFVWVRLRGTYGLREWGLEEALSYGDALAQILQQAGHPLTFQQILAELPRFRPYYEESSIVLTLGTNERFRSFPGDTYGLVEWQEDEIATEDYRLKRLFEGIEEPTSFRPNPKLTEILDGMDDFIAKAREKLSDAR
jgi:RNA polymerase sigma factor (sigma-70 family)